MITSHEARSIIRKAVKRVPEGEEIRHLNIMPMMDIMTILLVAFLFSAASGELAAGSVKLPKATSIEPLPQQSAAVLIITLEGIVMESSTIVPVRDGSVDANEKEGGSRGMHLPKLTKFLGNYRAQDKADIEDDPDRELPEKWELWIIADRLTPYRLLTEVILSARKKEAGYERFRLVVLTPESG